MARLKNRIFLKLSVTVFTSIALYFLLHGTLPTHANPDDQQKVNSGVVTGSGSGSEAETGIGIVLGTKQRHGGIHEKEGYNLSIICFQSPDKVTGIEHHLNCMKHISLRKKLVPHELKSIPMLISGIRKLFESVNVNVDIRSETEAETEAMTKKTQENLELKANKLETGTGLTTPRGLMSIITKNEENSTPTVRVTTTQTMFSALNNRHFMRNRYGIPFG